MKFLFATTNKAKIRYYGTKLKEHNLDIVFPDDLNINCNVEETGNNPIENAAIKATAYYKASGLPTIALDDGLFLEYVPEHLQPGTHVRRVGGRKLSDSEMIEYYISLVNQYGKNGRLTGYFLKGVAVAYQDDVYTFDCKASRCFMNRQSKVLDEGYPLASIQLIPSLNKFKSELTAEEEKITMDIEQKDIFEFILDKAAAISHKEQGAKSTSQQLIST